MLQLTQELGSGEMLVQEVPSPQLPKGFILVKNHFSVVSVGTEGATVRTARKSLLSKAKERPQQVKQVIETLKSQGPLNTFRAVTKKLDAYSPLGYSCSGEVVGIGAEVREIAVGDKVACAGVSYANHAELVCVPQNLCVKLDDRSDLKAASYNTMGSIAMQGVRQADLRIGESCLVIGLGLLGQLTGLILKASGINVYGTDINSQAIDLAVENGAIDSGYSSSDENIHNHILKKTGNYGVDCVIIAAATKSLQPINLAGAVVRQKGRVVVLGDVPTGFQRDPFWYKKELELRMACSYGPGRYDYSYEEKGIDYPYAYVRWTEKRNMESFQELILKDSINLDYLTTHVFDFENAAQAYELISTNSEFCVGIVLKYEQTKSHNTSSIRIKESNGSGKINLSFIGGGNYAQGQLLPNLPDQKEITRIGVLAGSGTTSKKVAKKFGFEFCTDHEGHIFNETTNTIIIATRHDSHFSYVKKALENNINVFVEKPLCLIEEELNELFDLYQNSKSDLMVGFNRRFSPLSEKLKSHIPVGPKTILYRINAGPSPINTWMNDSEMGGGRIVGEICHFIDWIIFAADSTPKRVSANRLSSEEGDDSVIISLQFTDGTVGSILYTAAGSKALSKEYIEVHGMQKSGIIEDFKSIKLYDNGSEKSSKLWNQDKGQSIMLTSFFENLLCGKGNTIDVNELFLTTRLTFLVLKSLRNNGGYLEV